MMFSGLKYLGKEPFHTVYIHGTILDENGQRMSKSLGNGIDPLEMIDQYGADAVRFSILTLSSEGQDIKLSPTKFEMGRNFANKLWNAVRFILSNCEGIKGTLHKQQLVLADKWILSRTNEIIEEVTLSLEKFRFADACNALYHFLWNDFCSQYLEFNKKRLTASESIKDKETIVYVFQSVIQQTLGLLHPFMPYLTEEINEQLGQSELLITSEWPVPNTDWNFPIEQKEFENTINILNSIRSIRGAYSIPAIKPLKVVLSLDSQEKLPEHVEMILNNLENLEELTYGNSKPAFSSAQVFPGGQVFVLLEGILDKDAEKNKLEKELARTEQFISSLEKKLSNSKFVDNAPEAVVSLEKTKLESQQSARDKLKLSLEELLG